MRRGSIIGPLILIVLGILFLVRNVWREIPLVDILSRYWPYLLIAWGVIRLVEIFWWALESKPLPAAGISGGEWLLVIFICILGAGMYTAHHYAGSWLPTVRGWRGVVMDLGESYDYPLASVEKPCAKNCRVLIESFQGNAHISGASDTFVRATGHETIRSFQQNEADQASKQTPLELIQQGSEIIVRTNQNRARGPARITSDLEITVPADSAIEAHGQFGDFNIRGVSGGVGLHGRSQDLQLESISGPVMVDDTRMSLRCESVPGRVRINNGDLTADNIGGPMVLDGRSSDVRISGVTQSLKLTLDRGDIDLRPDRSMPSMDVRTRSGDIELALPADAKFDLNASTDRGEARNDYGEPLKVSASRRGGTIAGAVSGGPQLRVNTERGDITVRKSSSEETGFTESPRLPSSLNQPLHVERQ